MPAKKKRTDIPNSADRLLLDSIVENIPHMIFVKDAKDLRFTLFNRAGETLLGHLRNDLIGKKSRSLFSSVGFEYSGFCSKISIASFFDICLLQIKIDK